MSSIDDDGMIIDPPNDTPEPAKGKPAKPGGNGGNGKHRKTPEQYKEEQAMRLAAMHEARRVARNGHRDKIKPADRIPNNVLARMTRFLGELAATGDETESAKRAGVSEACARWWWPERYPKFLVMREKAFERAKSAVYMAARNRAIEGEVEIVRRKKDKQGNVISEEIFKRRSDRLLERLLLRYFPEFKDDKGPAVQVNINSPEERKNVLVILSDPEARAALERARDRALLTAGEPGDAGPVADAEVVEGPAVE